MPNLTIKNLPDGLLERLRSCAEDSHRSLNSEVIRRLEQSVGRTPFDVDAFLEEVRVVRERAQLPYLTDVALRSAREKGRA